MSAPSARMRIHSDSVRPDASAASFQRFSVSFVTRSRAVLDFLSSAMLCGYTNATPNASPSRNVRATPSRPVDIAIAGRYKRHMTNRRCKVYGMPGTLIAILPCGSYAVRLDGEGPRVDYWHATQVEVCS